VAACSLFSEFFAALKLPKVKSGLNQGYVSNASNLNCAFLLSFRSYLSFQPHVAGGSPLKKNKATAFFGTLDEKEMQFLKF